MEEAKENNRNGWPFYFLIGSGLLLLASWFVGPQLDWSFWEIIKVAIGAIMIIIGLVAVLKRIGRN